MEEKIVISVSRTRDLVRCAPGLLAQYLSGRQPVRFARSPALCTLDPAHIGALALWTKDPSPLLSHGALRSELERHLHEHGGAVLLNLTVTGLGGTALEPGIPTSDSVMESTRALLEAALLEPEGIIVRYDPLIEVRCADESLGNIDIELFAGIARRFASMGVRRLKVSAVDYGYAHVPRRLARCGMEPVKRSGAELCRFLDEMSGVCGEIDMRCDVCCNPAVRVSDSTAGCIDGALINAMLRKHGAGHRVSERLHNRVGRQRPDCRCTYSVDIGYTPGIPGCFTSAGACLYCYSQRNLQINVTHTREAERRPYERA